MCATCSSFLSDGEELFKHACFDGKTIYSDEGVIYCLNDDNIDSNDETFNEFDHNSNLDNYDDTNIEREPYISQLKCTSPLKKPKKDGKLFLFYLLWVIYFLVASEIYFINLEIVLCK